MLRSVGGQGGVIMSASPVASTACREAWDEQPTICIGTPVNTEAKQIWPCCGPDNRISESPWLMAHGSWTLPEGLEDW